eukprot:914007-Pyramimonas_sp.AAC.1
MYETYFIRPSAHCYLNRGIQWEHIPNIFRIGLSCRADDTIERKGRQFVHAGSYSPGDNIIQSGLRVDSEVLIMNSSDTHRPAYRLSAQQEVQ